MAEGRWGWGYKNSVSEVRDGGVNAIGPAGWLRKEVKVVGGRSKRRVLVMKCNENDNVPCCGEYLSVMLDGVAWLLQLQKGRILRELGYLKGSVVELYKVSRCSFVE